MFSDTHLFDNALFVNGSSCDACSGLGTCSNTYPYTCACRQPTSGVYSGLTVITGADCSGVAGVWQRSSSAAAFLYFLAALCLIVALFTMGFNLVFRGRAIVRRNSFVLNIVAGFGGWLSQAHCCFTWCWSCLVVF